MFSFNGSHPLAKLSLVALVFHLFLAGLASTRRSRPVVMLPRGDLFQRSLPCDIEPDDLHIV